MTHPWRNTLISLGIAALLTGLYLWFFGLQTMMVLETRWMARRNPVVRLTPRALPDLSVATTEGTKLSYFGYVFEVPWSDLDKAATKLGVNSVVLTFRSGQRIKFTSLPPREFVTGILEQTNGQSLRQAYGDQPLQSDYAMWSLIVNATPEKVTLLSSRQQAIGIPILLVIKALAAPEDSAVYSVQAGGLKGFDWGDPQKHPRLIVLDLFADDGSVEFLFIPPKGQQSLSISQAEVNRVLQTVGRSTGTTARVDLQKTTIAAVR
jgi:hypothetical protein